MSVGRQRHALAALPPGMGPGTHGTRGWVDLDGCGEKKVSYSTPSGFRTADLPTRDGTIRTPMNTFLDFHKLGSLVLHWPVPVTGEYEQCAVL